MNPCTASSHAERHPSQPVIPPRNPPAARKGYAATESRRIARELADIKNHKFTEALHGLQAHIDTRIEELAAEHDKKPGYVKALLYQQSSYKSTRKENANNARIHLKGLEMNAGTLTAHQEPGGG